MVVKILVIVLIVALIANTIVSMWSMLRNNAANLSLSKLQEQIADNTKRYNDDVRELRKELARRDDAIGYFAKNCINKQKVIEAYEKELDYFEAYLCEIDTKYSSALNLKRNIMINDFKKLLEYGGEQ